MNRLILTLALVFAFFSCNNVEQYRAAIEGLSGEWDTATNSVTQLAETVTSEKSAFTDLLSSMSITEEISAAVGEETTQKLEGLKSQFEGFGGKFDGISSQITSFVGEWQEKAGLLNTLKEGLTSGDLSGVSDVLGTISSLKEAITGANTKVGEWTGQIEETKSGYLGIAEQFKALLPTTN